MRIRPAAAAAKRVRADWCVCTIPLSILGQIPMNVGAPMTQAIAAVPYCHGGSRWGCSSSGASGKRMSRSTAASPIPTCRSDRSAIRAVGFFADGKGVLLGAYIWDMLNSMEFTSMTPAERVAKAVEYGSQIHPQYAQEFDNGVAVAWHRVPCAMGCFGLWTDATRAEHYDNLCAARRAHRAGGRTRLLSAGMAGGRGHLGARCDRPAAPGARSRREFAHEQ